MDKIVEIGYTGKNELKKQYSRILFVAVIAIEYFPSFNKII